MYKVSELNPKDTVLDEIHEIQKKIYEEDKHLSLEGKKHKFIIVREEFCKKLGWHPKVVSRTEEVKNYEL
ncbi:MAG: hypothetical protein AB1393_08380 [Candidatus Edwardsbacteria bacterium]